MALVGALLALLVIGWIAVSSASIAFAAKMYDDPFVYIVRHTVYIALGVGVAVVLYTVPISFWQFAGPLCLGVSIILLMLVLLPGLGREVNGSRRWLTMGILTVQASELAKAAMVLYLAGYVCRHQREVRQNWSGFVKPMLVLLLLAWLLVLEPDFGSIIVMTATAFGMLFLAGVRTRNFLLAMCIAMGGILFLMMTEPYRLQRLLSFMDPWADPFRSGYQLTQSLIAFGRGDWWGVGLGNSVQKLFYLPEAHTDFVFAIFAEEFGLVGAWMVIALFITVLLRVLRLGRFAECRKYFFHAYLAYGIGVLWGVQVLMNLGVNTGLLPTKGLTLPFLSYGGSSIVVWCACVGILFRIDRELVRS